MSSAFTPPDTLTKDDRRTVADVRRTIWINGFIGLGTGTVTGMVGHIILQKLQQRYVTPEGIPVVGKVHDTSWIYKCLKALPTLGRNTFMLSFLGGGALGSMVLSTTAGKNAVHLLHPIFGLGKDENAGKSPYQIAVSQAKKQEEISMYDATLIERKKTRDAIATARYDEEESSTQRAESWMKRQNSRKEAVQDRIQSGRALSDSTGGQWSEKK